MDELETFIVRAKAAAYVGEGQTVESSRPGSHDLTYVESEWIYRDSYFGGTDFIGQEVVWRTDEFASGLGAQLTAVWAMNYYGRIVRHDLIDAASAGQVIKHALSQLYASGRFLGGWRWQDEAGRVYVDSSAGDYRSFTGREHIEIAGVIVYRLDYHGGLIVP
jgi:hypothetical protein